MANMRYVSLDVVLDPGRWLLSVGQEVVTPEPKVFELLSYLMRHPGRVVSKAELLDSLWSGDVVGESVLSRCVSCARKVLADDSRAPRFIRTLHGRGYEFIAPVATLVEAPQASHVASPLTSNEREVPAVGSEERTFVGRTGEMARLQQAFRALEQRRGGFVLVSGEPGIGKSRLLEELQQHVPASIEVHVGRGSAVEGAPPFLIWQQCFRSIVRARSMKVVRRALESAASGVRKLLLDTDRWQADDRLGWDSPSERFRTFEALARGLAELAEQRPLALLLDDLHAADLVSLLLLEFLAQPLSAPILLIGALRDDVGDGARDAALTRLRAACSQELGLPGLNQDDVRQLVKSRLGAEYSSLSDSLWSRTGGNPFFLSILLASAELPGLAEPALPLAVKQAISHRLAALDGDCRRLLRLAALCGQTFDAVVLSRAAELSGEHCLRILRAGCAARVIFVTGPGEFRFVHDLFREVLSAELEPGELPRLHLAVGRALSTLPSHQDARHAAVLAHHFVEAAHSGGANAAVDLSIRAGAYALRNFSYEEAILHFTRASRLLPLSSDADHDTDCAVLLDLGLAQISAGQREAGQATLHAVAERARELGDAQNLASVALNLAPGLFAIETGVFDPALVGLLREALALAGHADPKLRALLLARLALALYWSDTFDERVALCREARRLAEQVGTDDVMAAVVTAQIFALLRPGNLAERRALSDQAIELGRRAGDHQCMLLNRLVRVAMHLESGDPAAAWFEAEAFEKLAELTREPQSLWIVKAHRACRLLLDGQLSEVEQLAGACLSSGQRVHDHNALLTFGVHLTLVRFEQARAAEVVDVIRDYATRYPRIVGWRVLYASALLRAGQAEYVAEYESLKRSDFALPDDLNWMVSMAWLAEICHARNDREGAALLYERLIPFADRLVVIGYAGIACLGSVARYLALLSATLAQSEATNGHFEQALIAERHVSGALPLAHTLCEYARWLLSSGVTDAAQDYRREAGRLIEQRNLVALRARLPATGWH